MTDRYTEIGLRIVGKVNDSIIVDSGDVAQILREELQPLIAVADEVGKQAPLLLTYKLRAELEKWR